MKFLMLIFFFLGSLTFAQTGKNINRKKDITNSGYDVVSYFSGKPQRGSAEFSVQYQGVSYYFINKANKTVFQQNPDKYIPQYGGYCAYAMGDEGEKVTINPETYKIVNGKLYLFYNKFFKNTLISWNKDEVNLNRKADKNWQNTVQK
ncbi:hypothetical protein A0O34_11730 [Chryseobacterium glaciei]|uniref:YHS domain protein n=1 Tax=Chryseobacterium glaciei TaxID=1685010 RepID=A0A172XVV8_9FLAO|nr:YHS domain-containing (seleno)protein [Chryseobacterium glaciei]ANF51143.1 hypothetical protein A0O34_11730 [Chryseobacterium glaciei]